MRHPVVVVVQSVATTSEYRRRRFEHIRPTLELNEELKARVAELQGQLAAANAEQAALAQQVGIQANQIAAADRERGGK